MPSAATDSDPLLRVENLATYFGVRGGRCGAARRVLKAVDGVSFELRRGQTLGLVGESGCGKSTLARTILRLIPATAGKVTFDGLDVFALPPRAVRALRRRMQIVFQDPAGSLNPRLHVDTIVGEALQVHGLVRTAAEQRARVAQLLARVGLSADDMDRYPHEFSGGQRQRIGIARALALQPSLIVCDEPVSALDVSIQAQILNLLRDLQREFGLSYLFIAHNLAVVQHESDEVAVMYLGRIVEQAPTDELFAEPRHPYTRTLLAAAPGFDVTALAGARPAGTISLTLAGGEPPSPLDVPPGCPFHPRCPMAQMVCRSEPPALRSHAGLPVAHQVACHFAAPSFDAQDPPIPAIP
jgi:oligopeptide/dipeptide ABC transporter ATP-binding protein